MSKRRMVQQCAYLGCKKAGRYMDDVETAPGVIEKKLVCRLHRGKLTKHIRIKGKSAHGICFPRNLTWIKIGQKFYNVVSAVISKNSL